MKYVNDVVALYDIQTGVHLDAYIEKLMTKSGLEIEGLHPWDLGVFCLQLTGLQRQSHKDLELVRFKDSILKSIEGVDLSGLTIAEIGAFYGGLRGINQFLNESAIGLCLKQTRAYIFEVAIEAGCVINVGHEEKKTFDMLLACCPFGLFEPEDLVLVETVKDLKSRDLSTISDENAVWMANYLIEQGSYDLARSYLDVIESDAEPLSTFKGMLENRLNAKLSITTCQLLHEPDGNDNPYEPLPYERYPKRITNTDVIRIEAWHLSLKDNWDVVLKGTVDKEPFEVTPMHQDANGHLIFEVGPFLTGWQISYYFQVMDQDQIIETSPSYKASIQRCEAIAFTYERDANTFYGQSGKGNWYSLKLQPQGTYDTYRLQPMDTLPAEAVICDAPLLPFEGVFAYYNQAGETSALRVHLKKDPDERFYGFGERYNALNQSGEVVDNYVYNQYKDQGLKTYMPMPYYISSAGYGCWLDTAYYSVMDMGHLNSNQVSITVEHNLMTLHRFQGTYLEMIRQFVTLTGKPKALPPWAFGPWMSSNNWDRQSEVEKQVALTLEHDIPSTVLVIEAWSDEVTYYIFNDAMYLGKPGDEGFAYEDFTFPEWGRWPNPKKMVDQLHEQHMKCILWQIPVLKDLANLFHLQKERDEAFAIEQDYVVKKGDGTAYRILENWFKDSHVWDFTNPEAVKWWFEKRRYLVETLKIDGFKTDGGECIFGKGTQFYNGQTGAQMRNLYANGYIQAYYQWINSCHETGGITFSRAGYTGAQAAPAHWAGDERSTFDAFKRSLLAGLSAGISGIPFWGWDFAGFSGDVPTDELYLRSAAMATFCPIMQYHAESKGEFNQDRTPWNIAKRSNNPKVIEVYRYYAKLRMNLIPYIRHEAQHATDTGEPLMRALILDYESDPQVSACFDTYLFGRGLLVAPMIEQGQNERQVYLPEGRWIDFFTGDCLTGGRHHTCEANLDAIPVWIKDNQVIPLALGNEVALGTYEGQDLEDYAQLGLVVVGESIQWQDQERFNTTLQVEKKKDHILVLSEQPRPITLITLEADLYINGLCSRGQKAYGKFYKHEVI